MKIKKGKTNDKIEEHAPVVKKKKKDERHRPNFFARIGLDRERDLFLTNLSLLLASGITILDAVAALREEVQSKRLRKIVDQLSVDIESGESLSEALLLTGLFSSHVASLIRVGEQSGRLIENLGIIATEQKREQGLKSKLRSAAMYPAFVLALTLVVGVGVAWFILPKLALVFTSLNVTLPAVTRGLLGFGAFLGKYGLYAIPAAIFVTLFFIYFIFFFSRTRVIGEYLLLLIPGISNLVREAEVSRFGFLLGTLIEAGLSPMDSLDAVAQASTFTRYRRLYLFLKESVTEGNSFKKSFAAYKNSTKLIPVTVQQLIIAGEQSGMLSKTLKRIGDDYEAKTDASAKDLAVILEPILLVIVWLGVVAVAFAIILPIYSLIGGLQSS